MSHFKASSLTLKDFLAESGPIFDVRSPGEFKQGHIPGAINIPLLNDAERAIVGTEYKKRGSASAVQLGVKFVGPKLSSLIETVKTCLNEKRASTARIHCWRGGMRSETVCSLLNLSGIPSSYLKGGYKAFRRNCLEILKEKKSLIILGGMTGSGKTLILKHLRCLGEQVLDLEELAKHRGSAFGKDSENPQPSCEQFENEIAIQWQHFNSLRPIWIEDESRMIGKCKIPDTLYALKALSPRLLIERPKEERLAFLKSEYSNIKELGYDEIRRITDSIASRLGSQRYKAAIEALEQHELKIFAKILLDYYDSCYEHSLKKNKTHPCTLNFSGLSEAQWAKQLQLYVQGKQHEQPRRPSPIKRTHSSSQQGSELLACR